MKQTMEQGSSLTELLQGYIQAQANPDRVGCPTVEILEGFLRGQLDPSVAEGLYDHLPRCCECLLELRTLRDIAREEAEVTTPGGD